MRSLLDISDALFLRVNDFARNSAWLHAPAVAYAKYGLVVFTALLLVGVWRSRGATDRQLAAQSGRASQRSSPSRSTSPSRPSRRRRGRTPRTMVDRFPSPTASWLPVHRATLRELEPTTAQTGVETVTDGAS